MSHFVYRFRVAMCTFSLASSFAAILLLPGSVIGNEVIHLHSDNYYFKWLTNSLVQGMLSVHITRLSSTSINFTSTERAHSITLSPSSNEAHTLGRRLLHAHVFATRFSTHPLCFNNVFGFCTLYIGNIWQTGKWSFLFADLFSICHKSLETTNS